MSKKINTRIQLKNDVESNWNQAKNFIPLKGELIIYNKDETHNYVRTKTGDGETSVVDLPFDGSYTETVTDNSTTLTKTVPLNSAKYAEIVKLGGKTVIETVTEETQGLAPCWEQPAQFVRNGSSYSVSFSLPDDVKLPLTYKVWLKNSTNEEKVIQFDWYAGAYWASFTVPGDGEFHEYEMVIPEDHSMFGPDGYYNITQLSSFTMMLGYSESIPEEIEAKDLMFYMDGVIQTTKPVLKRSYSKSIESCGKTYSLPKAVQEIETFGMGVNDDYYNYIDVPNKKYYEVVSFRSYQEGDETLENVITDGHSTTVYPLEEPVITDLSNILDDIVIEVEPEKEITFINESDQPLPSTVLYYILPQHVKEYAGKFIGSAEGEFTGDVKASSFELINSDNKIVSKHCYSFGKENSVGQKAFVIKEVVDTNKVRLDSVEGIEVGWTYSTKLAKHDYNCGTIEEVDSVNNTVVLSKELSGLPAAGETSDRLWFLEHAEVGTTELGHSSFSEGWGNIASYSAHTEGYGNIAYGRFSHAEGYGNEAGYCSHAEGKFNIAQGEYAHVEGVKSLAKGNYSHASGVYAATYGVSSNAEGGCFPDEDVDINRLKAITSEEELKAYWEENKKFTAAWGNASHAEGRGNIAIGAYSHVEGTKNTASGESSHAEGRDNIASGECAHVEGRGNTSSSHTSHVEGRENKATQPSAHAEGNLTEASGVNAHAEGYGSRATTSHAHAEGDHTLASGFRSHAEGYYTTASESGAHSEGHNTNATATGAHAEGESTTASGYYAHAEGYTATANSYASHAEGGFTTASSNYQHVQGIRNIEDAEQKYAHIVGNGVDGTPSNAHTLDWHGNAWYQGDVRVGGTTYSEGQTLTTEDFVNNRIAGLTTEIELYSTEDISRISSAGPFMDEYMMGDYKKFAYYTIDENMNYTSTGTINLRILNGVVSGDIYSSELKAELTAEIGTINLIAGNTYHFPKTSDTVFTNTKYARLILLDANNNFLAGGEQIWNNAGQFYYDSFSYTATQTNAYKLALACVVDNDNTGSIELYNLSNYLGLATKEYADTKVDKFITHPTYCVYGHMNTAWVTPVSISAGTTNQWSIALREINGELTVGEPVNPGHAATKNYVDNAIANAAVAAASVASPAIEEGITMGMGCYNEPINFYVDENIGNQIILNYEDIEQGLLSGDSYYAQVLPVVESDSDWQIDISGVDGITHLNKDTLTGYTGGYITFTLAPAINGKNLLVISYDNKTLAYYGTCGIGGVHIEASAVGSRSAVYVGYRFVKN